jgi:outer membrane protein OmpA-like peptidoglycan-associated protein
METKLTKSSTLACCSISVCLVLFLVLNAAAQNYLKKPLDRRSQLSAFHIGGKEKTCKLLYQKRNHIKIKLFGSFHKKPKRVVTAQQQVAVSSSRQIPPRETVPVATAQPDEKKTEVPPQDKVKEAEEVKLSGLTEKENKEDEVLKQNNLPVPKSDRHAQIRKMVSEKLKAKKDNEPIELEPLYFNYNQDEFSVVDMDPFLVAVEYALQGRIVLIEGHTDNKGQDQYNVQLSLKRVQKIRSLMHDMGVPDEQISVLGYGEEISKFDNSTEEGKQKNRRVDFKF